jgi:hypothetical protein
MQGRRELFGKKILSSPAPLLFQKLLIKEKRDKFREKP